MEEKTHEKIMFNYIELCVDMRRGRFAKDGLIQYRIICQRVNVNSLEEVIKHYKDTCATPYLPLPVEKFGTDKESYEACGEGS